MIAAEVPGCQGATNHTAPGERSLVTHGPAPRVRSFVTQVTRTFAKNLASLAC